MSKPLKEDYIIRIKSRIEQHVEEPAEEEEKLPTWQDALHRYLREIEF